MYNDTFNQSNLKIRWEHVERMLSKAILQTSVLKVPPCHNTM